MEDPNAKFNVENLKPLVGEVFKVSDPSGNTGEITLSALNEDVVKGVECESFTAVFTGPENQLCQQGVYQVAHDAIGAFDLLVSPNSPTESEIVIARLKGEAAKRVENMMNQNQ